MAQKRFGTMIKAVVDIKKNLLVIDADLHADQEAYLLNNDSKQKNLWGINLYPEFFGKEDFIEFDSMINLRPSQDNPDRGVCDPKIRKKVIEIVDKLVIK